MLTRREFMQTATAAGAAGVALSSPALAAIAPEMPAARGIVTRMVVDQRAAMSSAFGATARAAEITVDAFADDISPLWRTVLQPAWKAAPTPIAGMTEHGPLFVLERMGWKHDMRATFRAQHSTNAEGVLEHEIQGPAEIVDALAAALPAAGAEFGGLMAQALAAHPAGDVAQKHVVVTTDTRVAMAEPIYSFVLAPRAQCCTLKPYSHNHSA